MNPAVEVPASHFSGGLVTVTCDEQGRALDWKHLPGNAVPIHSRTARPVHVAVAVRHRGGRFDAAANAPTSKISFSPLKTLFELQATKVPAGRH